jgi:hypothetical protein
MRNFSRLGRGTKPNIADRAQPNLPKTGFFVQALIKDRTVAVSMVTTFEPSFETTPS